MIKFYSSLLFLFFLHTIASAQNNFLQRGGSQGIDEVLDVSISDNNEVFSVGYYEQNANFGSTILSAQGNGEGFITKQNPDGTYQWAVSVAGSFLQRAYAVAPSPDGSVYAAGTFLGPTTVLGQSFNSTSNSIDVWVVKLSASGQLVWLQTINSPTNESVDKIVCFNENGQEKILLAGQFRGQIQLGSQTFNSTVETNGLIGYDIYLSKLNSDGTFNNTVTLNSNANDRVTGLDTDVSGNIYLSGHAGNTLYVNSTSNVLTGITSGFIVKLNPQFNQVWLKQLNSNFIDINGMAVRGSTVVLGGNFEGTLNATGTTNSYSTASPNAVFFARYNTNGAFQHLVTESSENQFDLADVAIDSLDNTFFTGTFSCKQTSYITAIGAEGVFNSIGFKDIYITQYDAQGARVFMQQFGGPRNDIAYAMDIKNNNSPLVVGSYIDRFSVPKPTNIGLIPFVNNLLNSADNDFSINNIFSAQCNDSLYGTFVNLGSYGSGIDCLFFSAFDSSRAHYDYFIRANNLGSCDRSILNPYINNGQDTVRTCQGFYLKFRPNTINYAGPQYNVIWKNENNQIIYTAPPLTGMYYLNAQTIDGCRSFIDSVYVIIDSVPVPPQLSSPYGEIFNGNITTSSYNDCANRILIEEGDTITVYGPDSFAGDSIVWIVNNDTLINVDSVRVTGDFEIKYRIYNEFGCSRGTCLTSLTYVLCNGIPTAGGACDFGIIIPEVIYICPGEMVELEINNSIASGQGGASIPAIGYWKVTKNDGLPSDAEFNELNDSVSTFINHSYNNTLSQGSYTAQFFLFAPPYNDSIALHLTKSFLVVYLPVPSPIATVTSNTSGLCPGAASIITFDSNYPYSIEAPNLELDNLEDPYIMTVSTTGTYSISCIVIHPTSGCEASSSASLELVLKESPTLVMNPSNGIKCPQDSVTLTAEAGASITWTGPGGEINSDQFQLQAYLPGEYYYNLVDFEGCNLLSVFKLVNNLNPIPATGEYNHICPGEFAQIKLPSDSGYYFYWQAPLTGMDSVKNIYQAGVYHVDTYICNEYTPLTFTIYQSFANANILFPDGMALCDDHPISLVAETGPYTYLWTPGNSPDTAIIADHTDYYKLQVTDTLNCTRRDSIYLIEHPNPPEPLVSAPPTCLEGIASLNASNYNNVIWFSVKDSMLFQGNPYNFQLNDTDIVVSAISTNQFGCYSDTVTYEVPFLLHAQLPSYPDEMLYCVGDSANITGSGGSNIASISWIGPNNFQLTSDALMINEVTFDNTGLYTMVPVPESGYCIVEDQTIQINAKTPNAPLVDYLQTICENGLIQAVVTVQPNYVYSWSGPLAYNASNQNLYISNAQLVNSGNYVLTSFFDGCYRNDTYPVNVLEIPNAPVIGHTAIGCENQPYVIYDAGNGIGQGYNLNWLGAENFQISAQDTLMISALSMSDAGTYYLQYQNNICLSAVTPLSVEVLPAPVFSLDPVYEFCEGESIEIVSPISANAYLWSNGAVSNSNVFTEPGNFWLIVEDTNGCSYASNSIVNAVYCDVGKIPNTFSPNGDGVNDALQFTVSGGAVHGAYIFDRWGKVIKEIKGSESLIWDGTNNSGETMMNGTYFFILDVTMINGNEKKVEGTITLFN